MELQIENLGKVSVTVDGYWDKNQPYDRLCIVTEAYNPVQIRTYISKKPVPVGIDITNEEYWQRVASSINVVSKEFIDKCFAGEIAAPTDEWAHASEKPVDEDNACNCDHEKCEAITLDQIHDMMNGYTDDDSSCSCNAITEAEILNILNS